MKVLNLKEYKNGSALMTFLFTKEEEEMFKVVAKYQHKRFDKFFIRKAILKALKRYVRIYNG